MNDLVIMKDQQAVTSSLQVAETFNKEHKNIIRDIEHLLESDSSVLSSQIFLKSTHENRGKQYPMYYMNRDGFTLLAMGFTGKKALHFKMQYINAFNQMEDLIKTGGFKVPSTMAEALRLAADQQEQLELMKPKAVFADAVATSHTSILVGELAKLIKQNGVNIGQNRLFNWLRENGYLVAGNRSDKNMPTQKSLELGLFEIIERSINNPDGSVRITKTPKVTGKGQQYFINKFMNLLPSY